MSNVVDIISLRKAHLSFRIGSSYHRQRPAASEPTRPRPLGTSPVFSMLPNPAIDPRTYASMFDFFSFRRSILRPHISGKCGIQTRAVLVSDDQSQKSAIFRLRVCTDNYSCVECMSLISPSLSHRLSDYDKSEAVALDRDSDMKTLLP